MHAIVVRRHGGPEVLEYADVDRPRAKEGEAVVRLTAIGVNFIDVYHRTGLYKMDPPFTPGSEAAGVVEEPAGEFTKGDRVAYAMARGAYAEYQAVAPSMLQGMTAHYLAKSTYPLKPGDSCLIHAAAGGVGGLLVQVAKMCGAFVYGTVSTEEKERIAREDGADVVIRYTETDFERVLKDGVNVVYDSVGKTTFDKSVDCVKRRGTLVLFGQSSGPVPPFDPSRLAKNGIYLTRPSLGHYTADRTELLWRANDVLTWIRDGKLKLRIDRELPLRDARRAHELLESRQTKGKLLLIP